MQRWLRRRTKPLDDMHQALGEFMSAQARVELAMVLLLMLIRDEDYEWLFDEHSLRTFGPKIDFFEKYTYDEQQFSKENWELKNQVIVWLKELLPKRNSIVHGETYVEKFEGRPKQPYRVGVEKKNIQYLENFSKAQFGTTIFTTAQVREATELCKKIYKAINKIRNVDNPDWWGD